MAYKKGDVIQLTGKFLVDLKSLEEINDLTVKAKEQAFKLVSKLVQAQGVAEDRFWEALQKEYPGIEGDDYHWELNPKTGQMVCTDKIDGTQSGSAGADDKLALLREIFGDNMVVIDTTEDFENDSLHIKEKP